MMTRRPLSGLLFLALAGVLAWGGTVAPGQTLLRWIAVAAMAGWGAFSLFRKREGIEHVYTQMLAMGLAIGAVGWLIPGRDSRGLLIVGGVLVVLSAGLLAWASYQRRPERDATDQPR